MLEQRRHRDPRAIERTKSLVVLTARGILAIRGGGGASGKALDGLNHTLKMLSNRKYARCKRMLSGPTRPITVESCVPGFLATTAFGERGLPARPLTSRVTTSVTR